MTARSILLAGAAALSLSGIAEAAPFHGWYVALEGGADWVQKADFINHFTGLTFADRYSFKTGWAALATVGYDFDRNWRVEGEAGYRSNDLDKFYIPATHFTGPADGNLREMTLMANVFYDIPLMPKLDLSLGAGAGGDEARLKTAVPAFKNHLSDDNWAFAYQGIAALNYAMGERSQLFVEYRYLTDTSPTFQNVANTFSFDDIHKHTVTLGLRFALAAQEEAPPPSPAAPPPPPPPRAAAQFMIFFGFNKCSITPQAEGVLGDAAAAAKSQGSASIEIVGHTDTVGSARYNQKLSECRANAAAKNLEGKGIPAGAIHTSGVGKTDLLVQTGDGVKEPQNRRDTISLH